jgi:hypothetical protein
VKLSGASGVEMATLEVDGSAKMTLEPLQHQGVELPDWSTDVKRIEANVWRVAYFLLFAAPLL